MRPYFHFVTCTFDFIVNNMKIELQIEVNSGQAIGDRSKVISGISITKCISRFKAKVGHCILAHCIFDLIPSLWNELWMEAIVHWAICYLSASSHCSKSDATGPVYIYININK